MKILALIVTLLTGFVLIYAEEDFPAWGDPKSPPSQHVSPRYISKAMAETKIPNMVTAVLADYRGYDTLFETTVIFAAGLTVIFLLRGYKND